MSAEATGEIRCQICGVVLSNAIELEEHMEVHAEQRAEGEPYQTWHVCAFCGQKFATPEELRNHHRTAHSK
jgi:DNA-directed RNA polymerase subunit RPC12/RpoP